MSKHIKYLTTAALAAALGAWASQAHAELNISLEGPATINAGNSIFNVIGTITAAEGTLVGIMDVSGIFGGTLSNGDVTGAFSNPEGNSLFSVLQPGVAGPGGTWGTAASPYMIRSTAVVSGSPAPTTGMIPAGGSLSFTLGTITFNPGTFSTGGTLSLEFGKYYTGGTAYPNAVWTEGTTTYTDLTADGGTLSFTPLSVTVEGSPYNILHVPATGITTLPTGSVHIYDGLDYAEGGTLDMEDKDLIIHNGDLGVMTSLITNAYDYGSWAMPGITSSSAANEGTTLLAIVDGDTFLTNTLGDGTYEGNTVETTDVIVKYTYQGDINLDGVVNDDDLNNIIFYYTYSPEGNNYAAGDITYDGIVNDDDLNNIIFNYTYPGAALAPSLSSAAVPEPASLALLALGAVAMLRRRGGRG